MKITPEANANTKKRQVAWFTIEGERKHVQHADLFLQSIGVDLGEVTTDEIDDEFYTSFPMWVSETKVKDLKHMRKQLKAFMSQKGAEDGD